MATISRNSKTSSGTTSFVADTDALAEEVEADFNTAYNAINGGLDNANIINPSGTLIDPEKSDDTSATDAEHSTTLSPGSSTSQTRPITLEEEIQQLRYGIERLALGIDADRNDGSSALDTFWGDLPARGDNLIANPNFVVMTASATPPDPPDLWVLEGTPSTSELIEKDAADGNGPALHIIADATDEGVSQTVDGLKASTNYLVVAVVEVNTGEVTLRTVGGETTGEFQDLDFNYTTTGTVHVMKGVVSTDSTPTNLAVHVVSNTNPADFDVHFVGLYECTEDHNATHGPMIVQVVDNAEDITYENALWTVVGSGTLGTDLTTTVYVPGPGYAIRVQANVVATPDAGAAAVFVARIREAVDGAAATTAVVGAGPRTATSGFPVSVSLDYVVAAPTPGVDYVYTVEGTSSNASTGYASNGTYESEETDSTLTVELVRVG
jgi:hypothetical protein